MNWLKDRPSQTTIIDCNNQNKNDKDVLVGVCSRNSEACTNNAAVVKVVVISL